MGTSGRKRILVVDDEPDVLVLCRINLELEGFLVLTASDGFAALTVAEKEQPDLILLDVKLRRMDGFATLERLKSNPATDWIPVVMLTGYTLPSQQVLGREKGAAEYLTKPFDPSGLVQTIKRILAAGSGGPDRR